VPASSEVCGQPRFREGDGVLASAAELDAKERVIAAQKERIALAEDKIGGALGISAHTAKFHVAQIIAKLQAQSRAHAVAKALRAGFADV